MRKFLLIFQLLLFTQAIVNAQVKVSMVIDDNYGLTMNGAVSSLFKDNPGLGSECSIKVFTYSRYQESDLQFLEQSDLVFVYTHNSKVLVQAKPQLLKSIQKGGRVYALNTSAADEEYEKQGILFNAEVLSYFDQKGLLNMKNMILSRLSQDFSVKCKYQKVHVFPEEGIYDYAGDTIYSSFDEFLSNYKEYKEDNPWIGMVVGVHEILMGQNDYINAHIRYIENSGFNVIPIYGSPVTHAMEKYFTDGGQKSRVAGIVGMALWHGIRSEELKATFVKLGVPAINCIQLYCSREEWESSPQGIPVYRRANFLAIPEISGQIQPTVTAAREEVDLKSGPFLKKTEVDVQVRKMVERLKAWYTLQVKPNAEKQVALIYYSYPPGKENIGASYLNVLPQSLQAILERMQAEGYTVGNHSLDADSLFQRVMSYGRNIGNWAPSEIAGLVKTGEPVLVPLELYKTWYKELSLPLRSFVESKWGKPDDANIMTWSDRDKKKYFVLPAVKYGNVMLMPQPARGWDQDISKIYHDVTLPPNHQYIAAYLYLQYGFRADALIHLGTHGTHEWLSGKEAGLNNDDPPEALIGHMVNIYPYIVDDVGEGLQAKRRGMAVAIDHMTPPFDKAGMNPELKELAALISDYEVAEDKSPVLASSKHEAITKKANSLGLMKDLGLDSLRNDGDMSLVEHYVKEIAEKQTPFGLHTFGRVPEDKFIQSTAEAIASRQKKITEKEKAAFILKIKSKLAESGNCELNSLIDALNGKYIQAGTGNDPLRNPSSLPTGKNFYAFDPSRIPSQSTYETGYELASELIDEYRAKHNNEYPEKVTMNLWSTECIRHEGIMESQILALMGMQPVWDSYGRVKGVKPIPSKKLGRPRIDVVMVPSGLYRDVFPNLMLLLDKAVGLVKKIDEKDNYIREHIMAARKMLIKKGITDTALVDRLASVRMFTVPSGAYGTRIADVAEASGTWEKEEEVAKVYFNRMGHLYGQGFWGAKPEDADPSLPKGISTDLFKGSLSGTDVVVHSRSSNVYAALDNDDFFQYLGATAMAVRVIDGKTPDVMVTNLSNPSDMGQETLDKFIGREMKSRYLNPKWIEEMLDEGYAGARFVNKVVTNLWGWQVTVPEAIDENKWQQMYETYIEDKYELDIREKFKEAGNLYAYQSVLSRMIETVRKDYWHPNDDVMQKLVKEFNATVEEVGLACNGNVCDNKPLSDFIQEKMTDVPDISKQDIKKYSKALKNLKKVKTSEQQIPSPAKQVASEKTSENTKYMPKTEVKGYEVQEVTEENKEMKKDDTVKIGLLILLVVFVLAFAVKRKG